MNQICDEFAQECCLRTEYGERGDCLVHRTACKLLCLRERSQRHIGRLVVLLIAANGLSNVLCRSDHVENVVRDLECKAEVVGVRSERCELRLRRARKDRTAAQRRMKECARLSHMHTAQLLH